MHCAHGSHVLEVLAYSSLVDSQQPRMISCVNMIVPLHGSMAVVRKSGITTVTARKLAMQLQQKAGLY